MTKKMKRFLVDALLIAPFIAIVAVIMLGYFGVISYAEVPAFE